ncbi:MAG: thioesterase family protein [Polyangiales bacterium]
MGGSTRADPAEPSYPCRTLVDVQWGDVDRMQHVNNVVYLRWMETARTRYFDAIDFGRLAGEGIYPILASIRCDYRAQLRHPDTISVDCSIARVGRTSATHVYRVVSQAQGKVVAVGEGTWVCFDYAAQRSLPLPAAVLDAIERYEGRSVR